MKKRLFLALSILLSISFITFAQEQQKEQPKDNPPPPKKKSLSMDMNDVSPAPKEDKPEETKPDKDKVEKDDKSKAEKEKKDEVHEVLEEIETALTVHKSFYNTVGNQTLVTFVNYMNTTLKDDQKFLLREKMPKQFIEVQLRLRDVRTFWGDYFTAWGKEIDADVSKNYKEQQRLIEYMQSCKNNIATNILLCEEIVKQYKKKNNIK